jgi:hypothetical protein
MQERQDGRAEPRGVQFKSLIGVLAPFAILSSGAFGYFLIRALSEHGTKSKKFASSAEFDVWSLVVGGLVALTVTVFMMVLPRVKEISKDPPRPRVAVAIVLTYVLFAATAFLVPTLVDTGNEVPLYGFKTRMAVLYIVVLLFASAPALGIGLIRVRLSTWVLENRQASANEWIKDLIATRVNLQRLLMAFTLSISGTVIATGALRNAMLAYDPEAAFGTTFVYLYGAFFTALLAIAYIPTFLAWRDLADRVVGEVFLVPHTGKPPQEWQTERKGLIELLKLDVGVGSQFTAAFGLLAPFASGVVTALIGSVK